MSWHRYRGMTGALNAGTDAASIAVRTLWFVLYVTVVVPLYVTYWLAFGWIITVAKAARS